MNAAHIEFSIVVLTCNQRSYTLRLLESLCPYLERHEDTELILVDNASTDGTLDAVHEQYADVGERIVTISNDRNLGVARARNIGLRAANGSVLMLLDNDTVVTCEAIDALRAYITANSQCGIAAPALYSPDGRLQSSAKPFPGIGIKIRNTIIGAPDHDTTSDMHPFYVIGACQVFRKELIDRVGWLDEKIFYGPEDADLCIRAREAGYTIDYLPHISIIHDWQRATRKKIFSTMWRRHFSALIYFYRKHRRFI